MVLPRLATEPGEQDRHAVAAQDGPPRSRYPRWSTRHRPTAGRSTVEATPHELEVVQIGVRQRASHVVAWQVPDRLALTVAAFATLSVAVAVVVTVIRADPYSGPPDVDWPVPAFLALGLLVGETSRRCWIRSGPNTYVTPVYLFAFALLLVGSPTGALWASMFATVVHALVVRATPVTTLMRLSKVRADCGIGVSGVDVARRDLVDGQRRGRLVALGGRRDDDRSDPAPGGRHRHRDRGSCALTSRVGNRSGARRRCVGDGRGCIAVTRADLDRRCRVQPSARAPARDHDATRVPVDETGLRTRR